MKLSFKAPCKSILLVVLSVLFLTACGGQADLNDSKGKAINLKDSNGRWTALNIWADWCEPCRDEIPELNALNIDGRIRVIGYDFDGSQGLELQSKMARMDIAFTVLSDSPLIMLEIKAPKALPATLLLNPEGKLVDTLLGPQDRISISSKIQELQAKGEG
ncbi:TlpA family protein disulfide reductase [Endozoicomonas sp. OPT23]|uniref:TlpA family protein disulfide reductase n=1 Tax=Endozoicomonas sp. OPT23 TaxID=2072845 RepID=UPI00129B7DC9|nr:TlpA disulfide reductase family protein [Endozoicomonas sp. OPT23]MRI35341.1 TlpA family protein disulfide reductase [Endozoicomonas sp. OPT23]